MLCMTSQDLRQSQSRKSWQIVDVAKVDGEGFLDMDLGEIQELIDSTPEEFTEDDLMELSVSEPVPEDKSSSQKIVDINQSGRRFPMIQDCFWLL